MLYADTRLELQGLRALRSPISAKEVLGVVRSTGLDAPILPGEDPRWERLRSGLDPGVNLRVRFRGALIGGAIGDVVKATLAVRPRGRLTGVSGRMARGPRRFQGNEKGLTTPHRQRTI